ncbi:MAG: isoprenylcysteine carboxylmethyltransferase family protein [Flavobacteriaceae bacterium]|nr:isoprenylcysteine carboxylmethyltransferase family protein [Flavobacteriaceae bacterium]
MSWSHYFLPPFLAILCIGLSFFAGQYFGGNIPITTHWLGYVIIIMALFNIARTIRMIRLNKTAVNTFKDPSHFIKTGPFKYSRNPIYLGLLMILIGFGLVMGSFSSFIGVIIFFIITDVWYIPFEEKRLGEIFGEEYVEYKSNVRRWL